MKKIYLHYFIKFQVDTDMREYAVWNAVRITVDIRTIRSEI